MMSPSLPVIITPLMHSQRLLMAHSKYISTKQMQMTGRNIKMMTFFSNNISILIVVGGTCLPMDST